MRRTVCPVGPGFQAQLFKNHGIYRQAAEEAGSQRVYRHGHERSKDDVIDILRLREPNVVTTGFDRPNLWFSVQAPKDRYATMKNYIECHPGQSGIIVLSD